MSPYVPSGLTEGQKREFTTCFVLSPKKDKFRHALSFCKIMIMTPISSSKVNIFWKNHIPSWTYQKHFFHTEKTSFCLNSRMKNGLIRTQKYLKILQKASWQNEHFVSQHLFVQRSRAKKGQKSSQNDKNPQKSGFR